jgi:hypothetical protein
MAGRLKSSHYLKFLPCAALSAVTQESLSSAWSLGLRAEYDRHRIDEFARLHYVIRHRSIYISTPSG